MALNLANKNYPLLHPLRLINEGSNLPGIEKGEGIYIFDQDGKRYIDGISGLWNTPLGHGNSKINDAVKEQLDSIAYVNSFQFSNPTTIEFCKKLLSTVPDSFEKVILACTGSEAVEIAIKLCRKYYAILGKQSKKEFIALDLSYHGTTFAAMSASGIDREYAIDYQPMVSGFNFFKTPFYKNDDEKGCLADDLHSLENLFQKKRGSLAGIIIEPIVGSGGVIPLPEAFIVRVRELCDIYDVLLIFDEVATGFGRTGAFFAFDNYNVIPDIICMAKGINNGYLPLAATVVCNKIINLVNNTNSNVEHFSTQNGNPIACAAGIATIDLLKENGLIESVGIKGEVLKKEILSILKDHPNFCDIRGRGLMIGVDLVKKNKKLNRALSYEELMNVVDSLFKNGLVVYPFFLKEITTGFSLFPHFIITENQISSILGTIKRTFSRLIV